MMKIVVDKEINPQKLKLLIEKYHQDSKDFSVSPGDNENILKLKTAAREQDIQELILKYKDQLLGEIEMSEEKEQEDKQTDPEIEEILNQVELVESSPVDNSPVDQIARDYIAKSQLERKIIKSVIEESLKGLKESIGKCVEEIEKLGDDIEDIKDLKSSIEKCQENIQTNTEGIKENNQLSLGLASFMKLIEKGVEESKAKENV